MISLDLSALGVLAVVVLAVAALGLVLAVVAVTDALVDHRHVRIARRQSVRSYYRGLALSH
jgi:hypothetical protein